MPEIYHDPRELSEFQPKEQPDSAQAGIEQFEVAESGRWGRDIVRYALTIDGQNVGRLELCYSPKLKIVYIDSVLINPEFRGKGLGRHVYKQVVGMPLPDGSSLREAGYRFVSSPQLSADAERVWISLCREGLAQKAEDGSYAWLDS